VSGIYSRLKRSGSEGQKFCKRLVN